MIVEQRDYHVFTGKLDELVRLYADEGIAIQEEILGGLVGVFTTDVGGLSTYTSLWRYESFGERERAARAAAGRRALAGVPREDPAADPHPAEPHPRPDGVLADPMSGARRARSRSSPAARRASAARSPTGSPREGARIVDRRPERRRGGGRGVPGRRRADGRRRLRGGRRAHGRRDGRALRRHRHPRQQRRPLRVARDAAVHRDPARRVAAGDGRERRLDVPDLPRGRAARCASAAAARS